MVVAVAVAVVVVVIVVVTKAGHVVDQDVREDDKPFSPSELYSSSSSSALTLRNFKKKYILLHRKRFSCTLLIDNIYIRNKTYDLTNASLLCFLLFFFFLRLVYAPVIVVTSVVLIIGPPCMVTPFDIRENKSFKKKNKYVREKYFQWIIIQNI